MSFSKIVINWYSEHKRALPWRETQNPYFIWLSEIILQQTQVKQGLPYYESFVKNFPTIYDLAAADEQLVLKLWQGLGYYSRARNLHAAAKYVVSNCNGVFPSTYKDLLKLKGVGDYTASAIASIAFNEATAVVDGNVYRVLSRYFGIDTPINSTEGIKLFKQRAQALIDAKDPATFNQAMMEFGAMQCKPKSPNCLFCPLMATCKAYNTGRIDTLPVKLKKTKVKQRYFNFLVFKFNNQKTLLEQRTEKGIWQNLYQFPLIETAKTIDYEGCLELLKTHDIAKFYNIHLECYNTTPLIHKLSHQHLHVTFWVLNIDEPLEKGIAFSAVKSYPVPIVLGNFIEAFGFIDTIA